MSLVGNHNVNGQCHLQLNVQFRRNKCKSGNLFEGFCVSNILRDSINLCLLF